MAKYYTVIFLLLFYFNLFSQEQNKSFTVKFISEDIKIDGILEEKIWESAESAKDFHQYFPSDSVMAEKQTDIKMLYSETTLYIAIKGNAAGKDFLTNSLQRDFRGGGIDQISLVFDTFNDGTNAFLFGINPFGVRREALISGGGTDRGGFTTSWDVKWRGESKIYDDYFTAEMAIPLTSFKFKEGETKWRFNSYRLDMQTNERTTWMKIPQNQFIFGLAFMGDMIFEKPLGKSRTPLALIPYVNTISARDFENNESITNLKVGGDAKIAIGNSLNLDLTVNPDFSTVEVDNFITNLTRFEVALPERRQFFVDNNDLFGSFGGGRDANPFFSRRIGIATDTAGNTIENRIIGGLRLSGKLDENLRLGFLNIQTEKDEENEIPSNNNMMFALQQKLFSRSNIGMFFINRQAINATSFLPEDEEFNRVIGVDYNLASEDNSWTGKAYAHKSFQPNDSKGNYSLGLNLGKNTRYFSAFIDAVSIDTWRPGLDLKNTDHNLSIETTAEFRTLERLQARFTKRFVFLTDEFEPTGKENAVALPGDTGYHFSNLELEFQSDNRKNFAYSIQPSYGGFFNGNRYSLETSFTLRFIPKVNIGFNAQYDHIELPQPYSRADIWLISPRVNITFNKSLFWSTLVQYSNQRDNLGINSRLQWRFAPLSDLFLVYNDNYFVNSFTPRSRSINLKFTYWLNI